MRKQWIIVALLPMAAYAFLLFNLTQQLQRDILQDRLDDELRSAALSIDRSLSQEISFLKGIANSLILDSGDLEAFRREMERARVSRQHVYNLILTDDQKQLVNLRFETGQPLPPIRDQTSLMTVWATAEPAIDGLVEGRIALRVPVIRDGKVRYTLVATIEPRVISDLLRKEVTPKGWIAAIIDHTMTIVARSDRADEFVGTKPTPNIVEAIRGRRHGLERTVTKDGIASYGAVVPVASTGWHIAMAVPVTVVEAPYRTIEMLLIGGGGLALATAAGLALLIVWSTIRRVERKAEALSIDLACATRESQEKSAVLAAVSHELRTPLNGVIGFADLLATATLGSEEKQWVEHQRHAGRTLLTLINDILDYSKIATGSVRLESVDFDAQRLIAQSAALVKPMADAKGLRLDAELDPNVSRWLRGDPTRLRQVIGNLLGNAVKFTAQGEVRLSATHVRKEDGGIVLTVAVSDTGIGIPADKHDRLFQPFSQVDTSTTREYGGTGLGLAICKSLVELMGGVISVDSVEGQGSTFWFTVQLLPAQEPPADTPATEKPPTRAHHSARILVAEDNPINQVLTQTVLERAGHTVVVVDDGAAAVDAVQRADFDLVLMDVHMPVLDGADATRTIRALDGPRSRVPILALTADAFTENVAACMSAGMDGHLAKPFLPDELLTALDELLTRRSGARPTADHSSLDPRMRAAVVAAIGPEKASFLLAAFLNRIATVKEDLLRARGDHALLYAVSHQLIGPAGMLGYTGIVAACRALCLACRSGDEGSIDERFAELGVQLDQAQAPKASAETDQGRE